MELVINKLNLDVMKSGIQATVNCKKGDILTRAVVASFRMNGQTYKVPNGATAVFRAKKPDGTVIYNNATVQDGKVHFIFTSQYCAVAGKYTGEIQLIKSGKVLYTPKFCISVEDNIYSDSEIESTNEYTQLTESIEDAEAALELAQNLHLIEYVDNLDSPGDDKYLYVLEEKALYIDTSIIPNFENIWQEVCFETTSEEYPFVIFENMKLYETYEDPGVIKFGGFPGGTLGNSGIGYKYNANTNEWEWIRQFNSLNIETDDNLILLDDAEGSGYNPKITNLVIKRDPLFKITGTPVVFIKTNSGDYYTNVTETGNVTYDGDDNPFDLDDVPEILTSDYATPYVYDEVLNKYVSLTDASLKDRIETLETKMSAAENDIDDIQEELGFSVFITHTSSTPTISKTFAEIADAIQTPYGGKIPVRASIGSNYYNGFITKSVLYDQNARIEFLFDLSDGTHNKYRTYKLTLSNVLSYEDSEQENQAKLIAGNNITIENNVISAEGGGSGSTYTAGEGISIDNNNVIETNIISPVYDFSSGSGKCNMTYSQIYKYIKDELISENDILKVFKPQMLMTYKDLRYECVQISYSQSSPTTIKLRFRRYISKYQFGEIEIQHTSTDYVGIVSSSEQIYTYQQQLSAGTGISIVGNTISLDLDQAEGGGF